jgi:hypothetical protein
MSDERMHCTGVTALQVMENPSYRQAATRISAKLQAQAAARHPMARAADAVEALLQVLPATKPVEGVQGSAVPGGDEGEL